MTTLAKDTRFVLCIDAMDCEDLEKSKVYPLLADPQAEKNGYLRVIDASGEDYLYPAVCFVSLDIPVAARRALGVIP